MCIRDRYYSKGANTMKTDVEKAKVEFKEAKEYLDKLIPLLLSLIHI